MADTTAHDIGVALYELSCRTGKTFYAAIHPCGSIAIVEDDPWGDGNAKWCNSENVLEKLKQTPGGE